jgi:lysozyme
MKTSNEGVQFIKDAEGMCLKAYQCSAGKWTIGVGHTSAAGMPSVHEGMVITEREAIEILKSDLRKFESVIDKAVKVKLSQSQFDALVSFVFNIGGGAFQKSTLLKKLNAGDYNAVPSELARWNKVNGKVSKGLTNRRAKEAAMWADDSWESDDTPNIHQEEIKRDVPTIINAENIAAATSVTTAVTASNMDASNPITWAIAELMVAGGAVFLYLFFKRRGS